ncbi:MAG: hypothetical protein AB7O48_14045, partial [Cyclobacteriaceae bacterium]
EYFMFFSPVFNIADSSIFIGVTSILVFQKRFFRETKSEEGEEEVAKQPEDNNVLISAEGHVMSVPVEADETKKEEGNSNAEANSHG